MSKENIKTCEGCDGKCCKYVVIELDAPEDQEDFQNIRWFVSHKNVNVYVEEDNTWNVEFITPCEYLDENDRCTNYEKRPDICKEYDHDECPFHNNYTEKYSFKKLEDIDKYIEEIFERGMHEMPDKDNEEESEEEEKED